MSLVLASVLAGATVVSASDNRTEMWTVSRTVASGTTLQAADLHAVDVQLGSAADQYLRATEPVLGQAVRQDVRAGELLSRASLGPPEQGVSLVIPVRIENAPRIGQGDRITVWLSTKTCRGVVLVSGVTVQDVRSASSGSFGGGASVGLLARLPGAQARRAAAALDLAGAVLRVGVLSPDESAEPVEPNLDRCAAS